MKALFLSVTAGHGHHSAAKSAMSYLMKRGVECAMLDTFEYINPVLSESIAKCNSISTKFTQQFTSIFTGWQKKNETKFSITKIINSVLSKKLVSYIEAYNPDVIICTHVFAAQIVTALNNSGLKAKSVGIITDFTIHPFWEDTDLDYYITASELLNY